MFALLPLLGKKLDDLTLDDFALIKKTLKVDVEMTDELRSAGIAMLKGEGVNSAADLIQKPESIQKILAFFTGRKPQTEPEKTVIMCPHCRKFFF